LKLEFFKEIENNLKKPEVKEKIDKFLNELSDFLDNLKDKADKKEELDGYRIENCIYQVVDFNGDGVYLQNTSNNIVFEETNISGELKEKIGNDSILRYKNGEYVYEEELTEDFLNKLVDVVEFKKIQEKFIKESNIKEIDLDTRYKVLSREEDYTILEYNEGNTIEVPNALIPYFTEDTSILYYKNGRFERDL